MNSIRKNIVIIEPSDIVNEGLLNMIRSFPSVGNVLRHDTPEDLISGANKRKTDAVLINPFFIKRDIRHFSKLKRESGIGLWIGILYSFYDRETLATLDGVIQISDSQEIISSTVEKLLNNTANNSLLPSENLTERETEVLQQLVAGLSNKEIADKLNISIHTVISHRKNIVQKTGIRSQSGLVIYAISNHIITLDATTL
ncbi:MAG: response regulator transcription factor [Bacteroidales bacterium]|nr:response regulator transcription factor [Bacteroidales bacterium]